MITTVKIFGKYPVVNNRNTILACRNVNSVCCYHQIKSNQSRRYSCSCIKLHAFLAWASSGGEWSALKSREQFVHSKFCNKFESTAADTYQFLQMKFGDTTVI
jgi:hypothetical protein